MPEVFCIFFFIWQQVKECSGIYVVQLYMYFAFLCYFCTSDFKQPISKDKLTTDCYSKKISDFRIDRGTYLLSYESIVKYGWHCYR